MGLERADKSRATTLPVVGIHPLLEVYVYRYGLYP